MVAIVTPAPWGCHLRGEPEPGAAKTTPAPPLPAPAPGCQPPPRGRAPLPLPPLPAPSPFAPRLPGSQSLRNPSRTRPGIPGRLRAACYEPTAGSCAGLASAAWLWSFEGA